MKTNSATDLRPAHLTKQQYDVLRPQDDDTPRTKAAKSYIKNNSYVITPEKENRIAFVDLKSKEVSHATRALFEKLKQRKDLKGIYRFRIGNRRYVGKAADIKKRFSSYKTEFTRKNPKTTTRLASAVRESCENNTEVHFGVVYNGVPNEALDRVEDLLIKTQETTKPDKGFNQRAGGGGSSERKPLTINDVKKIRKVCEKVLTQTNSKKVHQKAGKFKQDAKGRVVLDKTDPQKKDVFSKAEGVVYSIEDKQNNMRYIGKTTRKLSQRVSEHLTYVNDPAKKREKPLYDEMLQRPEDFRLRVLYTAPVEQRHILEEVEKAYILRYKAHRKSQGYNGNTGSIRLAIQPVQSSENNEVLKEEVTKIQTIFKKLQNQKVL